jgi:hypothetical protein
MYSIAYCDVRERSGLLSIFLNIRRGAVIGSERSSISFFNSSLHFQYALTVNWSL